MMRVMQWRGHDPRLAVAALVLALFTALQCAALWHDAEHGFLPHKHNGHACQVYEYCQHLVLGDAPAPVVFHLPKVPVAHFVDIATPALVAYAVAFARPRAPPVG